MSLYDLRRFYAAGLYGEVWLPYDPGAAARHVAASAPPLGVTWRHPYKVSPETLELWRADGERNPIFVHPRDFGAFMVMARQALTMPLDEDALALQCRMAARFPVP